MPKHAGITPRLLATYLGAQSPPRETAWTFAVSGDSRNCGYVVMPSIAAGAREHTCHAANPPLP